MHILTSGKIMCNICQDTSRRARPAWPGLDPVRRPSSWFVFIFCVIVMYVLIRRAPQARACGTSSHLRFYPFTHPPHHCLQARCIESSFYRVLEASKIRVILIIGAGLPSNSMAKSAPGRQTSWPWMPPKSMKINKNL